MALTKSQALGMISASVLLPRAPDVLSNFECELVGQLGHRWLLHGMEAVVTDMEWQAFEAALDALRTEVRRRHGDAVMRDIEAVLRGVEVA